ncbi:MAG TPA: ABC transporter ATP-binding protein [Gordonia polyisoprenivorans]|uniref:ABC transporter ATP-binding protein n=1 Tax=Gordonia polyisoprenivorans TaxID=84595 RepID=UPI00035C6B80|nr:ATP-binding cassette domain-containing protein [Gordonia polyisoprenivorans]UZF56726.1 ATP-binding cassette domain-containing protein [Gordonia polyisoprenivorans]HCS58552.1 ABC transporter ATP-binding protein [Gordonia polyisoprenivorans]
MRRRTETPSAGKPSAPRGPLRPVEIASIAIFGGLAVAAVVIAAVIPLASAVRVLAPVPLALIAARTRPRATVAAAVATTGVAFAMAGSGAALSVFGSAVLGGIIGELKRRGRGVPAMLAAATIVAPVVAAVTVLILLILKPLRELVLAALSNSLEGAARWIGKIPSIGDGIAHGLTSFRTSIVDWWWLWILVSGAVGTFLTIVVAWWILGAVITRLSDVPSEDTLDAGDAEVTVGDDTVIAPLPMTLRDVEFSYEPDGRRILRGIDMTIEPGEFIAVVGANGSGKSTLAKILAGRHPSAGTLTRPGAAGLGRLGGTAMVLQRPETQMLGSRVADDVVWGLPAGADVDVEALLAEVGLAGLGERETSDLSGGQQQRLAIAGALARNPALLIADEVTSMVDPQGREEIMALLTALPRTRGVAVVLITHRASEAAAADRVVHIVDGRVVPESPTWFPAAGPGGEARPETVGETHAIGHRAPLLRLTDVGHTYLAGSPWEVRALSAVSLTVDRGDGLLIVGGNGSGKTTLAWIMAGLIAPSEGTCELSDAGDWAKVTGKVGEVGLAFQHARLQIQKQNVGEEIMAAGGEKVGTTEVARALESVGLPRSIAAARTDSLSGGQMRRVVLAGLLARRPEVLVLDEPLAGLDPGARTEVIGVLAGLRRAGMTIVIISHDFASLGDVCDRRVHLVRGVLTEGGTDHVDDGPALDINPHEPEVTDAARPTLFRGKRSHE